MNLNKLIPLAWRSGTPDELEPSLVSCGFKYRQLVKAPTLGGTQAGYHTKHDHQGFSWRRDLEGKVHHCAGMPIIEIDDGGVFAIQNANEFLISCWSTQLLKKATQHFSH